MNSSTTIHWTPPGGARTRMPAARPARVRLVRFSASWFLAELLLSALPAAALLGSGRATWAAYYFWGTLGLLLIRNFLAGRRDEALCLLLAAAPFINLLRQFAFYNVILFLYLGAFLYYYLFSSKTISAIIRDYPLATAVTACVGVYYVLSFYNTHDYAVNLRYFELVLTIAFILILGRNPRLLGTALAGLILCACLVGVSMLPYVRSVSAARLGMIEVEGRVLGNPGQLGVPLAFGFLALTVDRGQWLNLKNQGWKRLLLLGPTLPLLALTTSRAAWFVAATGIATCILLGSRQRLKMVFAVIIAAIALSAVMLTPYGANFQRGIERTFGDKRSIRQRTSGRSDLWKVSYYAFSKSIDSMVRGYGPGSGGSVYAKFSRDMEGIKYGLGKRVALHCLFMQIVVEAGSIGLSILLLGLLLIFIRTAHWTARWKLLFPLVCFFGYVLIIFTVSGNDINSGVFLGMALLGTTKSSPEAA